MLLLLLLLFVVAVNSLLCCRCCCFRRRHCCCRRHHCRCCCCRHHCRCCCCCCRHHCRCCCVVVTIVVVVAVVGQKHTLNFQLSFSPDTGNASATAYRKTCKNQSRLYGYNNGRSSSLVLGNMPSILKELK